MITFRYHVVTLVAVFMAIGLGVLFGATFIDQNIVDGLRAAQARLGDRNEDLRGRIVDLEDENQALLAFTGSTRDLLVPGTLSDVPVLLVTIESTPGEALEAVRTTLTLAGARIEGQLRLSDRLDLASADNREALAAALGSGSRDAVSLSGELVSRLGSALSGQDPQVLSSLLEAELVSAPVPLQAVQGESGSAAAVIFVGGESAAEINERIVVPLARFLSLGPAVTAVVEEGVEAPLLEPIRDESDLRVMTVDSIETPLGQSALAVGLKGALDGRFGHYGRGEGATTALPVDASS